MVSVLPFFQVDDQFTIFEPNFYNDDFNFQYDFVLTVNVLLKGDWSVSVPRKKFTLDEKVELSANNINNS